MGPINPQPCGVTHEIRTLNEHSFYETLVVACNRPAGHDGTTHYSHAVSVVWEDDKDA